MATPGPGIDLVASTDHRAGADLGAHPDHGAVAYLHAFLEPPRSDEP